VIFYVIMTIGIPGWGFRYVPQTSQPYYNYYIFTVLHLLYSTFLIHLSFTLPLSLFVFFLCDCLSVLPSLSLFHSVAGL
jgi:hypothetical protein